MKKVYLLDGEKGQVLKAKARSRQQKKNVHLGLFYPNGDSVLGDIPDTLHFDSLDLVLPKTSAYELHVYSQKSRCHFILEASVEDAPVDPGDKKPWLSPEP